MYYLFNPILFMNYFINRLLCKRVREWISTRLHFTVVVDFLCITNAASAAKQLFIKIHFLVILQKVRLSFFLVKFFCLFVCFFVVGFGFLELRELSNSLGNIFTHWTQQKGATWWQREQILNQV